MITSPINLTTSSMYSPIIFDHFINVFTYHIWPLHQCIHLSYLNTSLMYSPIIYDHFTNQFDHFINVFTYHIWHWVSEWLLFNANSAIFQLYHGKNKLIFNEMMMKSVLYYTNNSLRVDMSLHSDTLFWFQANQSLLFILNAACLAEKQQIPIL